MSGPVFHRFGVYGPVCGTRDGVNAGDMDPPEITCRRCQKAPSPNYWDRWQVVRRDGSVLAIDKDQMQPCPECGGGGFIEHMDPECCGNLTPGGECRSHCAVPNEWREGCDRCRGAGQVQCEIAA